ncbi:MAG: family 2 glycosyl transferase [Chloroflexi bacterium RBG_16_48_8]|nr:MAG: family 2 glycosyl transferase [Chloroflexi bacterium RBG_16_48_8]
MENRSPRCSIVIRSYNEEEDIGRLLTGVLEQTVDELEIILVDSGSTDATVAIASHFPVHILNIVPEEFSFGHSLNVGCAAATGEFIVISSAHVYPVYKDWLEKLLEPFSDPQVALVYGRQRGNQHTKFSEHQIFASWFPSKSIPRQSHPFCNNANAAIRQMLWEEHPYNETLPALEDLDWATWAMDNGYHISYASEAEIIHVHNEAPGDVFNRYRREAMGMNRLRLHEKFHWWDFLRLYLSNVISDCWYATKESNIAKEFWGILWFRLMQFWGTYRGYAMAGPLTSQLRRTFYYPRLRTFSAESNKRSKDPIDYSLDPTRHERGS